MVFCVVSCRVVTCRVVLCRALPLFAALYYVMHDNSHMKTFSLSAFVYCNGLAVYSMQQNRLSRFDTCLLHRIPVEFSKSYNSNFVKGFGDALP